MELEVICPPESPPRERFRVGLADEPGETDPWVEGEAEAVDAAAALVEKLAAKHRHDWPPPVAVWDRRCDIVHLFAFGQQFRSV
jgi:hypothetical protein